MNLVLLTIACKAHPNNPMAVSVSLKMTWVPITDQSLAGGEVSEEAVLDWLCLHLDPADMPRRFAGAAQSRAAAAGIKVVAKADEAAAAARR